MRSARAGPSPRAWGSRSLWGWPPIPCRSIPTCVGLTRHARRTRGAAAVHPHVRGAHCGISAVTPRRVGPSPRAWGSPPRRTPCRRAPRSIPTCVGLTYRAALGFPGSGSIPTCVGLTHLRGAVETFVEGPSPRAWGSRAPPATPGGPGRSIPTCVGLTGDVMSHMTACPVHPHVRGAHPGNSCPGPCPAGPSPRAWGSPRTRLTGGSPTRSIPTCVGLTRADRPRRPRRAVHPHVRGAHGGLRSVISAGHGPSPRAWGSRDVHRGHAEQARSIPTCVGLTWFPARPCFRGPVHPHVRGAHLFDSDSLALVGGPSPRAWGSRRCRRGRRGRPRSIPTCVGLTPAEGKRATQRTVHPHVRGAHRDPRFPSAALIGPSPRAWGSPVGISHVGFYVRSIPTCVGLTVPQRSGRPFLSGPAPRAWGAHQVPQGGLRLPRSIPTCVGLTAGLLGLVAAVFGPSPRAWGSPSGPSPPPAAPRSIPTCVGLTGAPPRNTSPSSVHPHVRGAHCELLDGGPALGGPSPRAWGSPQHSDRSCPRHRSIPTCVGLTRCTAASGGEFTVHPHVRGAHARLRGGNSPSGGPSPRAWGSQPMPELDGAAVRSIPTCVGLTARSSFSQITTSVHPHVRGAHMSAGPCTRMTGGPSPRAWGSRPLGRLV